MSQMQIEIDPNILLINKNNNLLERRKTFNKLLNIRTQTKINTKRPPQNFFKKVQTTRKQCNK